jgi:hypothetical protein
MNSGGYTYFRLEKSGQSIWAAALEMQVKVGDSLTVPLESPMENFTSKTLNRTFPIVYFVNTVSRGGQPMPAGPSALAMASSHDAASAAPQAPAASAAAVKKIPPPPGGMSIADVWAKFQTLGGQRVTVRGQVVKVNNGILGRNWIHLRDGSGSADRQDHDITVTTTDMVTKGEVVTIHGKVALDQDFTAGYAYPVMIEGAKVVR